MLSLECVYWKQNIQLCSEKIAIQVWLHSLLTWLFCFSKLPACDLRRACAFRDKNGKGCKPDWRDAPSGKSYLPSYNVAPGAYT